MLNVSLMNSYVVDDLSMAFYVQYLVNVNMRNWSPLVASAEVFNSRQQDLAVAQE
jgi:hypothetical protein